jgi:hypothetical protein
MEEKTKYFVVLLFSSYCGYNNIKKKRKKPTRFSSLRRRAGFFSSDEQKMAEETPTIEQTKPEVVANVEFINWKYPPYCELCNVYFSGEKPSQTHFEGNGHKNRLHTWRKYQDSESLPTSKNVLCNICWKEMNTQKILDDHCKSPAHLKEEKGRLIVQRLKAEYRKLKE